MVAYLLEVGCEELPASFVDSALEQWRTGIPASLAEAHLQAEQMQLFCKRDPCPTALRSCAWKRYLDIQDSCHWQCWQGQKIQGSVLPGG